MLLLHERDSLVLVNGRPPGAPALRVGREGALQLGSEAEIVDDEPAWLVLEHPIDAGDGLHQAVAAHWLVDVHRVQARRVEPREPHVAHEHGAQRVVRVAEALRERLAPRLVADVLLPIRRVRGRARHHHLDRALVVFLVLPLRAQPHQLPVELDADAAAHADDHRLALDHVESPLVVLDDVLGDQADALLGADDGLELRPARLEPLLLLDLLALGRLLKVRIDRGPLVLVDAKPGEAVLVVDRHGGAVLHRPLDVVDADVVAEDGARIRVAQLDWRAGEADERGVRQRVAHVAREAVDEVVLAAVRLVGDNDDVAPPGERGVRVTLLLGVELLDRREHHSTHGDRELLAQVGAALRLRWRLAEQVLAAREGAEELVVEVVAVGEDDDGRVVHRRLARDGSGVEGHRQALASALRVPDDADAAVAGLAAALETLVAACLLGDARGGPQLRCAHRLGDGSAHGVELVVAGQLLLQCAATVVLEHDEVVDQSEQPLPIADTLQQDPQLDRVDLFEALARHGAPRLEPLPPRGERAEPRLSTVRGDEQLIHREQRGQLGLVGLELLPRLANAGLLVGRVLELDQAERQAVDEQQDIGPARVVTLADGDLV